MSLANTPASEVLYTTYHQHNAPMRPTNKVLIRQLIRYNLFDPAFTKDQNGLQGLFDAELHDDVKPILRLIVATVGLGTPVGVATIHRILDHPDVDHVTHVFVTPDMRNKGVGNQLIKKVLNTMHPGMGMNETELSKPLLRKHRSIWPMRKPTVLDRDLKRCLRALEGQKYVTEDGSAILCSETVVDTLKAQDAKIKELQRQLDIARP